MTRIAIHGAGGRMGRALVSIIAADENAQLSGAVDHEKSAALGQDAGVLAGVPQPLSVSITSNLAEALADTDVVIDFSLPDGTLAVLETCLRSKTPVVIGTTGFGDAVKAAMQRLAEVAPVVFAPNYSVGVNVFWALAERAATLFADDVDLEIVEMHHHHKVDAPSGTATRLLDVVAKARGLDPKTAVRHGRAGQVGARTKDEIGMHALRGGDVVGDHTLILAGPSERIELTHRAHSREIFARGAVRAAHWVVGKPVGLYGMADVLGLNQA